MLITTPRWVSLSMMSVQLEIYTPAWDQIESRKTWSRNERILMLPESDFVTLVQETGTLIGLHSPWDDGTTLRHGVPLIAVERFAQQYPHVGTVHSALSAARMRGRFSGAILQNGRY